MIVNVYNPLSCNWSTQPLPSFTDPTLYSSDFNLHHTNWVCAMNDKQLIPGTMDLKLQHYMPVQPKMAIKKPSFQSARWQIDTDPDLSLITNVVEHISSTVITCFPHSPHQSTPAQVDLTIEVTNTSLKGRWNFCKGNWNTFTTFIEENVAKLSFPMSKDVDSTYQHFQWCNPGCSEINNIQRLL